MKTMHLLSLCMLVIFAVLISCKKETVDTNKAPVVNAGADASYYWPAHFELDGSATDADGTVKRYEWSYLLEVNYFFGDDAMNKIANATLPKTFVHKLNPGTHAFLLLATDDKGATGKDWVNINIIDTLTTKGKEYFHPDVVFESDNGLFMNSWIDFNFLYVTSKFLYYNPARNMEVSIMPASATHWQTVPKVSLVSPPSTIFEYTVNAGYLFIRRRIDNPSDNLEGTKANIRVRFL